MPGSKSISVFPSEFFAIDSASQNRKLSLCEEVSKTIEASDNWTWSSDKSSFWLKERNTYYAHLCDKCSLKYSYPVRIVNCPSCSEEVVRYQKVYLGKIEAASTREWSSSMNKIPEVNEHLLKAAQDDLRENPVQEAGFDWGYLKDNL